MKKVILHIFFVFIATESYGQVKVISVGEQQVILQRRSRILYVDQQQVALRKYDNDVSRFWGIGLNISTDFEFLSQETQENSVSEKRSGGLQDFRLGLFLTHGKQKYNSEKWGLWLITSLSTFPQYYWPDWSKNDSRHNSLRYSVYSQALSSLELVYRLNERLSFYSHITIVIIEAGATYSEFDRTGTSYQSKEKQWRYSYGVGLGARNLTLTSVGLNYRLK